MVSLTIYDGAMGIGGNKIYLEEKGKSLFLDFSKNFAKYGLFYEEFLKNRDTRGKKPFAENGFESPQLGWTYLDSTND